MPITRKEAFLSEISNGTSSSIRVYDKAIDVESAPFTYVETEEKIEQLLTEGEERSEP